MQTVTHNGKTLTLEQDAYIDTDDNGDFYTALAADTEGNNYILRWEITIENPEECDDESNMCSWDNYTVRAI